MRHTAAEAFVLENQEYVEERRRAPELITYEGAGADARARRGVSQGFVRMTGRVICAAVLLFALGCVSIALTWGTVSRLQTNEATSSAMTEIAAQNGDLRMECARMARAERVSRIATQNLGMVYATDAERMAIGQ